MQLLHNCLISLFLQSGCKHGPMGCERSPHLYEFWKNEKSVQNICISPTWPLCVRCLLWPDAHRKPVQKICMIIIALRAYLMVYDLKTSPLRPILVCPFFADSLYLPVSAVVTNTLPKILYPEFLQEQAVLVFHYDHSKRITCPLLSCPQVFLQLFHINTWNI